MRDDAPAAIGGRIAWHARRFQPRNFFLDIVAHEPDLVRVVLAGFVQGEIGWRQPEEQSPIADIDMRKLQHIAEERRIGIRVRRIGDDMCAVDYFFLPIAP